jgi:hypothetical protein
MAEKKGSFAEAYPLSHASVDGENYVAILLPPVVRSTSVIKVS